jgi:hypothetical protein
MTEEAEINVDKNAGKIAAVTSCRRGETTYAMGWLKWGPN